MPPSDVHPCRIGTVAYLNAVPLNVGLDANPDVELTYGVPSAIADDLAAGNLDAALVPIVEAVTIPGCRIVPHVAIACEGPVLSVKLFARQPISEAHTVALDPSSRTSAILARLWLEVFRGMSPDYVDGTSKDDAADAALLIGDPALRRPASEFDVDLGEAWFEATGLPFVFAVWATREGTDAPRIASALLEAKRAGVKRLDGIAEEEGSRRGLPEDLCRRYLTKHIRFDLSDAELAGMRRFLTLASEHGLVPATSLDFAEMLLSSGVD